MRIEIVVFDGFDELDAIGPYEVLTNAAALGGHDLSVRLVTREPQATVRASHGLEILPQGVLGEGYWDLVLVPGGGYNDRAPHGTWAEIQHGALPSELGRLHAGGATVAAVCTGGMLLSAAGLTRGRPATTHHAALAALAEQGAEVVERRVVDDGDLVTAGGVTSGLDLALWLVEREFGRELAERIAREMEHPYGTPVEAR